MSMDNEDQLSRTSIYGFADAATAVEQRHPQWSAVMARLEAVINLAFTRTQVMNAPISEPNLSESV